MEESKIVYLTDEQVRTLPNKEHWPIEGLDHKYDVSFMDEDTTINFTAVLETVTFDPESAGRESYLENLYLLDWQFSNSVWINGLPSKHYLEFRHSPYCEVCMDGKEVTE